MKKDTEKNTLLFAVNDSFLNFRPDILFSQDGGPLRERPSENINSSFDSFFLSLGVFE